MHFENNSTNMLNRHTHEKNIKETKLHKKRNLLYLLRLSILFKCDFEMEWIYSLYQILQYNPVVGGIEIAPVIEKTYFTHSVDPPSW